MESLAPVLANLTTPDKEDQTLLVVGDRVHIMAIREFPVEGGKRCSEWHYYEAPLDQAIGLMQRLGKGQHNLGLVLLAIPTDAEPGTHELYATLRAASRRAGFNFGFLPEEISAVETLTAWTECMAR